MGFVLKTYALIPWMLSSLKANILLRSSFSPVYRSVQKNGNEQWLEIIILKFLIDRDVQTQSYIVFK